MHNIKLIYTPQVMLVTPQVNMQDAMQVEKLIMAIDGPLSL